MKLRRVLSVLLVIALVITTANFVPNADVNAKAKKKYVKSIKVKKSVSVKKGSAKTVVVRVKTKGKANKKFTVKVKNSKVASVSKKGKRIIIKGKKVGRTKIIIKSKGKNKKGKKIRKTISVSVIKRNSSSSVKRNNSGQVIVRNNAVLSELVINEPDIDVGVEKEVLFTGEIQNSEEDDAYLVIDENGNDVGYIYDDGCGDDETEGDGIFAAKMIISSNVEKEVKYYVLIDGKKSKEYATAFFYKPFTDTESSLATSFMDSLDSINSQYDGKTDESAKNVFNNAKQFVENQKSNGVVKEYNISEYSILIELESGIRVTFEYPSSDKMQSGSDLKVIKGNGKSLNSDMDNPHNGRVATFEPFRSWYASDGFDDAAKKLANSKYKYEFEDNYDDNEVTVELAKHLDDYNAILWCGHGGHNSKDHSYTALAETVKRNDKLTNYRFNMHYHDIKANRLVVDGSGHLWMTKEFINRYYRKHSFKNTLFFMGTCLGAKDDELGKMYVSKGVGAYFGYEKTVDCGYNDRMVDQIVAQMEIENLTAKKALDRCVGWFGNQSKLKIIGNENYKIGDSNRVNTADKYDIVLTWGADPCDMDSHLEGFNALNEPFHVYYSNPEAYENNNLICELDADDTTSYGPETITLKATSNRTYYYYVYRYAGEGSVNTSKSVVSVFKNGILKHVYAVGDNNGEGDTWNVFALKNGKFVERNTITNNPDNNY